jgi:hypothetical protein
MYSTDTPLTGQAPIPLPVPVLGTFAREKDASSNLVASATPNLVAAAIGAASATPNLVEAAIGAAAATSNEKAFGIVSALDWAQAQQRQEGVKGELRVRNYIWIQADDLEEALRPVAAELAQTTVANLESMAASFGVETALAWAGRRQVPSWHGCRCFSVGSSAASSASSSEEQAEQSPSTTLEATHVPEDLLVPEEDSIVEENSNTIEGRSSSPVDLATPRPNYNHHYWPSPRPKLFAKSLGIKARTHQEALQALANRAHITVPELLEMNPLIYESKYMPMRSHIVGRIARELYHMLPARQV